MYLAIVFLSALVSSISSAAINDDAVAQRFLLPSVPEPEGYALIEDLTDLLMYIPENFLELFDPDDFPDPFELDLDELQKLEESIFGGLFPFRALENNGNVTNQVRAAACTAENAKGTCIDVNTCSGKPVPGHCPGLSNIQCCIPRGTSCTANGKSGVCIDFNSCSGTPVPGFCPGLSNIQCCVASGTSTGGSTGGSCGSYAGAPLLSIGGNGNTVYSVVKIKPEHLTNPSAYNYAPDKSDNTITPSTACAFHKMVTAAASAGVRLTISSGFRTIGRQQYFWNCFQTKKCNRGNKAARVGFSNHGRGIALDLNTNCGRQTGSKPNCGGSKVYQWLKANAHRYGFVRTEWTEPWHWEYRGIGAPIPSYM